MELKWWVEPNNFCPHAVYSLGREWDISQIVTHRQKCKVATVVGIIKVPNVQNGQINKDRKWISGCLWIGKMEELGLMDKKYGFSFWVDGNILKLIVFMISQLCEYTKNCWIMYTFKGWIVWHVNNISIKLL